MGVTTVQILGRFKEIMSNKNILSTLLQEAQSYTQLEALEKLVQEGGGLKGLPIQPLYLVMKELPEQELAGKLSLLDSDQRRAFLDLDLWQKDDLDVTNFESWLRIYESCPQDVLKYEFVTSPEFLLFLKGRLSIWTFDVEDPQYPDHDNYFLTEDDLLLFEYDESFQYAFEVQNLIKKLYAEKGVENAYSYLFKLVTDSFLSLQEQEYRLKKLRLDDYGFIDYYEALEFISPFSSLSHIDHFIKNKPKATGELDSTSASQGLHRNIVIPYTGNLSKIENELTKIKSSKRNDFLRFSFLRLVNGTLTLDDAMKSGRVAIWESSEKTRQRLDLGFEYILKNSDESQQSEGIFGRFDFSDLYKIGHNLLGLEQKKLKKALRQNQLKVDEVFLGNYLENFLDESLGDIPKLYNPFRDSQKVDDLESYGRWRQVCESFCAMFPYINEFKKAFDKLKSDNKIQDSFYLNYDVTDIEFESILLTQFMNFLLKKEKNQSKNKMGLTLKEFKQLLTYFIDQNDEFILTDKIKKDVENFSNEYGLSQVPGFRCYLDYLLQYHLEGYEYSKIKDEQYKHVGGPILLVL